MDNRKICPTGWHVPLDDEWEILINNLGGVDIAGGKLKETGTSHWKSPNTGATNETKFTALPGGVGGSLNLFEDFSSDGFWWSSTQGEVSEDGGAYNLYYKDSGAHYVFGCKKWFGFSVRCIKD